MTLKIPCNQEIEISVILTLQSCPLPIESSVSFKKLTICTTFTHVFFKISSVLTDSKNKKWLSFGKSIPKRSMVWLPTLTKILSNEVLHNSHSSPSHIKLVKWSPSLTCFFWSSQFLRHDRWIYFIVPEHLHGAINCPSFSWRSSSPKHILQVDPLAFSYSSSIFSNESSFILALTFYLTLILCLVCSSMSNSVLSILSLMIL